MTGRGGGHLQSYGPCEYEEPSTTRFKVVFWKMVLRKQHCFLPHSDTQALSLMENSVHGLSSRVECAKTWASFLLSPYQGSPGHIPVCGYHSAEGAVTSRWGDPKDGGRREEPQPKGHRVARGPCKHVPAQRLHQFLGDVGWVSLLEVPPTSGDWVLMQREGDTPGPLWGHISWHMLPAPVWTEALWSGDQTQLRSRDMTPSRPPCPEGSRVSLSDSFIILFFPNLIWHM